MRSLLITILLLLTPFFKAKASLPDSMLTVWKAIEYTIVSPDTSHAIIEAMRQRQLIESWRADCLEGDFYVNQRQYRKALPLFKKVLDMPELKDSVILQMKLVGRAMMLCEQLQQDDELTKYGYQLLQMAEKYHQDYYKAHALFLFGKRLHYQEKAEGIPTCLKALDILRKTDHPYKNNTLRRFYGEMLLMYMEDSLYNDAIRMSLLQEEVTRIPSLIKMRHIDHRAMRHVYALRTYLYSALDKMDEADKAYMQWRHTTGGNAVDDKYIIHYLEKTGRYEEALHVISAYRNHISREGDSVSYWMLSILGHEAIIYGLQNRSQESIQLYGQMQSLAEQLHKADSRDMMESTYAFLEERDSFTQHSKLHLGMGYAVVFLLIGIVGFYLFYNRQQCNVLAESVSGDEGTARDTSDESLETANGGEDDELSSEEARYLERLYASMDKKVNRGKLFLNPNLSRTDLMNLLGIDKNRFGKMMAHCSDTNNVSVYINTKRAEYAAELLKEHPEYTMATIADMAGMSNTVTLNRIFRQRYGVKPSKYRTEYQRSKLDV